MANRVYQYVRPIGENDSMPGTFTRMWFIPRSEFANNAPVNPTTGTIYYSNAKLGKSFREAILPPTGRAYTEETKYRKGKPYYEITITCFIPFESKSNHLNIDALRHEELIIHLETASGLIRVIGDEIKGAKLSDRFYTGEKFAHTPGTYVVITYECIDKPPFLVPSDGAGPVDPGGPGGPGGSGS